MARDTYPVPLFQKVYRSVDGVELSDENMIVCDGYTDELGATVQRPGSATVFSVSSATGLGFTGLFYWRETDTVYATSEGIVYTLTYSGRVPRIGTSGGFVSLGRNSRAMFASDGGYLFIVDGGQINYITTTGVFTTLSGTSAPTSVSHIDFLDGYVLANSVGTNSFYWSDVNNPLSWGALNFASAAGSSDDIVALKVFNREIYLFGQRTIEIWENDGATPFIRVAGGFIESGCSAPYSIISDENMLYWLDHERRFVRFNGKSVETLETTYDREIRAFPSVSDCYVMKIPVDGLTFFVFQFPSANRTLAYNTKNNDWSEWGKYDPETGGYSAWIGGCHAYVEPWGLSLIGRRDKLLVSRLSKDIYSDDGDIIRLCRKTGHINYGTLKNKASYELRLVARRGEGVGTDSPKLMIRYKLDNAGWSQPRELSLGRRGEYELVLRDKRRNIFRTKQYEFTATDAAPIVFIHAEEDLEVLR